MKQLTILTSQLPKGTLDYSCVCIVGEAGTGRSTMAKMLHDSICGAKKPFITVSSKSYSAPNVGAETGVSFTKVRDELLEKFKSAEGGTLLVDDAEYLPFYLQRAISNFYSTSESLANLAFKKPTHLIATTLKHPTTLSESKKAFADFFHLLSKSVVELESLRHLKSALPQLVMDLNASKTGGHLSIVPKLSERTVEVLKRYSWPGNITELSAALDYALDQAGIYTVEPDCLPPHIIQAVYFDSEEGVVNQAQETG